MTRQLHLLVIDPQNDFCDLPDAYRPLDPLSGARTAPALPVPGAHADMQRLARLVEQGAGGLAGISVTLDSHHRYDIAHPTFWQRGDGSAVPPFTQITAAEVRAGAYRTRDPQAAARALAYLDQLEQAGRYTLMVWPVHCEIGSWGNAVHADLRRAYDAWEDLHHTTVNFVIKGTNPWTEHYSAVQAEVVVPSDDATQLNRQLLGVLEQCERVYIAGEAGSHCVKATTEHIVQHIDPAMIPRLVLLTDCMSPVTGFEDHYRQFVRDMQARGVQIASAADAVAELQANQG
ncbi:cysteine hydrolase [Massilia arenosa]|uniref:Cysteine hydrolase n=1 Tax=Zemynaea arenosa TaxID=2561931 RepID=A0A4Y9SRI0_9BURK|nr:cysteine hydrolase [Massilia arenosa]TFW27366.1 cysteine hydrolase [Massilia arenosa]